MLRQAALLILCIAAVHAGFKGRGRGGAIGGLVEIHRVATARFNQRGVVGEVTFVQERIGAPVDIVTNLVGLDQFTDNYRWSIHNYPVRNSLLFNFPCTNEQVGGVFGPMVNTSTGEFSSGDLTNTVGPIRFNANEQVFASPNLNLFAVQPEGSSFIGRSLVIDRQDGPDGNFICANIEPGSSPGGRTRTLRATFNNGIIQGDVIIRKTDGYDVATIDVDIHYVNVTSVGMIPGGPDFTWSINFGPAAENCAGVGQVYGSAAYNPANFDCTRSTQRQCIIGDLTSKCGVLTFDSDLRARSFCADSQLGTVNFASLTNLIVRVGGVRDGTRTLGCAPLTEVPPLRAEASFRGFTEVGDFVFFQDAPDDETFVKAFLTGLRTANQNYMLRLYTGVGPDNNPCSVAIPENLYRIPGRALFRTRGELTPDACAAYSFQQAIPLENAPSFSRTVPISLPLYGPFSIIGRTLALVDGMGNIVACSAITNSCTTCTSLPYNSLLGYQNLNFPTVS